jgi:DNA polymerase III alpha subunit (gram-positive type)
LNSVEVSDKDDSWNFIINSDTNIKLDDYIYFNNKLKETFIRIKNVSFSLVVTKIDYNLINEYYQYILDLCKEKLIIANIFKDSLKIDDANVFLETENSAEENQIKTIIDDIRKECGWMYETKHSDGTIGKINL